MQNTHFDMELRRLHRALVDIIAVMNRPQRDEALIRKAGVALDRALFPLLVGIDRFGPIGVVDLADLAGRDHTTVSRQVAKLEQLGLITRRAGQGDRRVREALVTETGSAMLAKLDAARVEIGREAVREWDLTELSAVVDATEKLAGALKRVPDTGS